MSRYIIKLTDKRDLKDYYLEWSTIVDAPVTYGMTLDGFKIYYQGEYGISGMRDLPERLKRVEEKGTSAFSPFDSVEDTLSAYDLNRDKVGDQKEYILENFCRNWNP